MEMALERLRLNVQSSVITPNYVVIIKLCSFPSLAFVAVFPDYFLYLKYILMS